jgi:PHD/YefM family antitoxin component YafN of YafNO toxin-antitoxin module
MAMTLRLPDYLAAELREAAEMDHRSVQQTVLIAVEAWLAARETAEIKSDPDALRALAAAREEIARGEVSTTADVLAALAERQRHSA